MAAPAPATTSVPIVVSDIPQKKLKFMLVSTHLHQFTGYSKVAHNLVNELVKNSWLSLTHFGFQKHPQTPSDFRAYPAGVDVIDAAALERSRLSRGSVSRPFLTPFAARSPMSS